MPLLATVSAIPLLIATLFLFGAGLGAVDSTVNLQAVIVERASGRNMMSGFHGLFSVGGIAGAAGVSALLALGLSPLWAIVVVIMLILAALLKAAPHLLPYGSESSGPAFAIPHGVVLFIGVLCFIVFLAEGAMLDWSAVFLSAEKHIGDAYAGLGYAAFAGAMALARFLVGSELSYEAIGVLNETARRSPAVMEDPEFRGLRGVARIIATDQEARALACARDNVDRLGIGGQVELSAADLYPPGRAALVVCNPPWLPGKPSSGLEYAVYDPDSRMLKGFLAGLSAHLLPGGEGWLILSDLAEHLKLRAPDELARLIEAAGLQVVGRLTARPLHPRASDPDDPLHAARAAELTSLWRLAPRPGPAPGP